MNAYWACLSSLCDYSNSCHKFLGAYTFKYFPNTRSMLQCYWERMTMASFQLLRG